MPKEREHFAFCIASIATKSGNTYRQENAIRLNEKLSSSGFENLGIASTFTPTFQSAHLEAQRRGLTFGTTNHTNFWKNCFRDEEHFACLLRGLDGKPWGGIFPMYSGECGVWISFYDACSSLLRSNHRYLLWLEDDTVLTFNFKDLFCQYLEELNSLSFDFCSFGFTRASTSIYSGWKHLPVFQPYSPNFVPSFQPIGGGAILISRSGAHKITDYAKNHSMIYTFDMQILNTRSENFDIGSFYETISINPESPQMCEYLDDSGMNAEIDKTHPKSTDIRIDF